jgi:alkylation response protein AidB-like acyl-CoA dehydrogenase
MDFELNQEQKMWREVVHDFVAREVKPKAREVDEMGSLIGKLHKRWVHLVY